MGEGDHAVRGVSHLSLSVTDLARSLEFYRHVVGLPVLVEPFEGAAFSGREAMLLAGRVAIALQAHDSSDGSRFDPLRTGLDHLAFHVSSYAALEDRVAHLRRSGVECSDPRKVMFGWIVEFRDPDGIQLEFFARA